jgi:hypothetical protein
MKPIFVYFITPPINTELTEPDVSNQVSGANIQAPHVVLEPEVSNEQTANEGFDANILHAHGDEHIVSNEGSNASILQAPIQGFSV